MKVLALPGQNFHSNILVDLTIHMNKTDKTNKNNTTGQQKTVKRTKKQDQQDNKNKTWRTTKITLAFCVLRIFVFFAHTGLDCLGTGQLKYKAAVLNRRVKFLCWKTGSAIN